MAQKKQRKPARKDNKKGGGQAGSGGGKRALSMIYPEQQKFECRDCPARCCSSWGIPVSSEERERILDDDEARPRLGQRGEAVLRAGVLPMRVADDRLVCVFLDDDELCSLQKRHGHEFLPATCQAFPFGFYENEEGAPVALLSRYCPSIRDNYGEPVGELVEAKFEQTGGAHTMAAKMGLRSGRTLRKRHYATLVNEWMRVIEDSDSVADALCQLYDFTEEVDKALPLQKDLSLEQVQGAIQKAREATQLVPLTPRKRPSFTGRILVAYLLGGLCLPSRLLHVQRVTRPSFMEKVASWGNRLAWLFGVGRVRLLYVERPVPIAKVATVSPFIAGELGALVRDYLAEVLLRRYGMAKQTYLHRVLVDLAMMVVLLSRYARAAAAAEDTTSVEKRHVLEGIGIAELLLTHQGESQHLVLQQLRYKLMSNREDFRRLLAQEL